MDFNVMNCESTNGFESETETYVTFSECFPLCAFSVLSETFMTISFDDPIIDCVTNTHTSMCRYKNTGESIKISSYDAHWASEALFRLYVLWRESRSCGEIYFRFIRMKCGREQIPLAATINIMARMKLMMIFYLDYLARVHSGKFASITYRKISTH